MSLSIPRLLIRKIVKKNNLVTDILINYSVCVTLVLTVDRNLQYEETNGSIKKVEGIGSHTTGIHIPLCQVVKSSFVEISIIPQIHFNR